MQCDKIMHWVWRLLFFATVCYAAVFLNGCGGGDGSGDGGDGDGTSYVSFGELDVPFGGVVVNHFSDYTLSLKNGGDVALSLGRVEAPDAPFTIQDDQCSGTALGPSGTCDIQVRFSPTAQGNYVDAFVVPLSGSDTAFATVNLEGDGRLYNVSINQIQTDVCPSVRLIVSVTDSNDDFVPGLGDADFLLIENGEGIDNSASDVVQGASSNMSVVLALDTSGSVGGVVEEIIAAAKDFISDVSGDDEVAVFKFAESGAEQVIGFTAATDPDGKEALTSAIDSGITYVGGNTALFTAISDISDYIAQYATDGNRLAILVITDGEDTASAIDLETAISISLAAGIPIFTIGSGVENTDVLQQLADDTGGQYYDAPAEADLADIYLKTSALFANQYEIEYASSLGGGAASIELEVVDGDSLLGDDSREFAGCSSD